MFRNESDAVMVKAAKAKEKPVSKSKSPPQATSPTSLLVEDILDGFSQGRETTAMYLGNNQHFCVKPRMPNYFISPTIEERSLGFFGAMAPMWFRGFDLVETLCAQADLEQHLRASVSAVGLASFSNASHSPELMRQARKDYVTALQLTNAALRSPTTAKKDSTLFSVMVLSIYEMITGSNQRSLESWAEHIKGAAALVKLRGPEQFRSPAGQRMFLQVTSNMMLSCIQRTMPMPDHMIELREEAKKYMDTDSPAWRLSGNIIDFTVFRAAVRDCEIIGTKEVIKTALEIDQRFFDAFQDLPKEWQYYTVYTDELPHLVWNGNYHVYNEYWMSHIWNGMRVCRILLHEMIRDRLLVDSTALTQIFTPEENSNQLQSSIDIMLTMQADILASVPHHTPSFLNQSSSDLLDGSRSYFVLWPLFLVGAMDLATEEVRQWAVARLRDIGDSVGIRQANVVADIIAAHQVPSAWETKPAPRLFSRFGFNDHATDGARVLDSAEPLIEIDTIPA